jgi:fructoselysine-6-P-deglycase FrlB-like protein
MFTLDDHITFAQARAGQTAALRKAIGEIAGEVHSRAAAGWFHGPGPIFVGIGASLAAACAPTWSLRSRGVHAWRLGAGDHPLPFPASSHPLLAISQSGRSTETLAVLESVEHERRYALTNASPSPIEAAAAYHVSLGNVPDSYASTIGYTATIVGLGMIADAWDSGQVDPTWSELPDQVARIEESTFARLDALAAPFAGARSADFVGAGPSLGSAEAGALLFREVVRLPSAGMSTRQYLHGCMESAGGGVHIVIGGRREIDVAHTLSGAGHPVVLMTGETVPDAPNLQVVHLPALPANQRAIIEAIVLQSLVSRVAEHAGIDIEEFVFHNVDTKVSAESRVDSAE